MIRRVEDDDGSRLRSFGLVVAAKETDWGERRERERDVGCVSERQQEE